MQPSKCEVCGGEVEFRQEGSTQGYFCKCCDWALVTTYIPQIQLDETTYEVFVTGGDYRNEQQVKAVSTASGLNFLAARKLLQLERSMVFQGEAAKVKEIRETLANVGLHLEISPEFPY